MLCQRAQVVAIVVLALASQLQSLRKRHRRGDCQWAVFLEQGRMPGALGLIGWHSESLFCYSQSQKWKSWMQQGLKVGDTVDFRTYSPNSPCWGATYGANGDNNRSFYYFSNQNPVFSRKGQCLWPRCGVGLYKKFFGEAELQGSDTQHDSTQKIFMGCMDHVKTQSSTITMKPLTIRVPVAQWRWEIETPPDWLVALVVNLPNVWSSFEYSIFNHNCNTFSATIFECGLDSPEAHQQLASLERIISSSIPCESEAERLDVYKQGDKVWYYSQSKQGWVAVTVTQVDAHGAVELDWNPGVFLDKDEVAQKVRPRQEKAKAFVAPVYNVGQPVWYWSETVQNHLVARIMKVDGHGGVEIDLKPGFTIPKLEVAQKIQPREQGPVRQQAFVASSTEGQVSKFKTGDRVRYFSGSYGAWIDAVVTKDEDAEGVYLDVKQGWPIPPEQRSKIARA